VPKSRVRSKAVYTPPQRSTKAKVSPRWLAPAMIGCLLAGLAWISTYYISSPNNLPVPYFAAWNLVIGFVFIIAGVVLATKWH
jgi:Cell division protein CrgA